MNLTKIIIAPDSFKGTMSSIEVCETIEQGVLNIRPEVEIVKIPIADGGEGTVDALLYALGGKRMNIRVKGPYFEEVDAFYGILNDGKTAVIEMASASGLTLVGEEKNPLKTTTYGTGEMILDALNQGCTKMILGIGGSSTNDGGIGMASALGVRFFDSEGKEIPLNGEGLSQLHKIDMSGLDQRIEKCEMLVACDVDNPLYGPNGAAYIYAPQKGADEKMVETLDQNLKHFAEIVNRDIGIDVQSIPGSGAAGGLGAGLVAYAGAKLTSGINIILDMILFDQVLEHADLVITGEGKIDTQSLSGKVPVGIAERAKKQNKPVIAIVGAIGDHIEDIYHKGLGAVFSINRVPMDFEKSKNYSRENLLKTTESIIRFATILGN